jgi:hypothetical protein
MPLAAYFRNVGAVLLALLLIADFYLPASPVVQKAEVYRPVIRIFSERKGIEPVIFDTTQVVFAAVTPRRYAAGAVAPASSSGRTDASHPYDLARNVDLWLLLSKPLSRALRIKSSAPTIIAAPHGSTKLSPAGILAHSNLLPRGSYF